MLSDRVSGHSRFFKFIPKVLDWVEVRVQVQVIHVNPHEDGKKKKKTKNICWGI